MIYIALGIIGLLIIVALFTFVGKKRNSEDDKVVAPPADCCGAHVICEKKLKICSPTIEYFDDEELDAFKNADPDEYTDEQIEMFREILYTIRQEEVEDWLISLQKREIELPTALRAEALEMLQ